MQIARLFSTVLVSLCLPLAALAAPAVTYSVVKAASVQTIPADGSIYFRLRTTDIMLMPGSGSSTAASAAVNPGDACSTKGSNGVLTHSSDPTDCLNNVSVVASPAATGDIYLAKPSNGLFTSTKLSVATLDNEDDFIKSVTVNYSDTTTQVITSAGTAIAAGAAFGPYGMAAAGIVAVVGGAYGALSGPPAPAPDGLTKDMCSADLKMLTSPGGNSAAVPWDNLPALALPVSIDISAIPVSDKADCWHLMPAHPTGRTGVASQYNGWLYRIKMGPVPDGTVSAAGTMPHFDKDQNSQIPQGGLTSNVFPVTACRSATLDIVWWTHATADGATYDAHIGLPAVADSTLIKKFELPKAGTITLGTICGASVSPGNYSGSTPSSNLDALVSLANQINTAASK